MKVFYVFLFFAVAVLPARSQLKAELQEQSILVADSFVGIDTFGGIYFVNSSILYKNWNAKQWQFGDFALGEITSVSLLNPLKILLFYESSNTIVYVDKYLNEIKRIDFNTIENFKNVSLVSPANDTQIWSFDTNTQVLEIFNSSTEKTIRTTQPIAEIPEAMLGNFNFCWLLTSDEIHQYNSYGSLLYKYENQGYMGLQLYMDTIILQKNNDLYYLNPFSKEIERILLPEITIKHFYVAQEMLYIYDQEALHRFTLQPSRKN